MNLDPARIDPSQNDLRRLDAALVATLAVQAALRALLAFRHRVNVDEPQHLQVAWGWTQGLVQYRDVFDNHAPLFHLLSAPIVAALGERPDIMILMRLALLPLVALTLLATYAIGRRLYTPRVALWSVAIGALWPEFVRKSAEYRADVLWMAAWVSAIAVLARGRLTGRRCFAGGVLLGVTAAASVKSVLLLASLAAAAVATIALTWGAPRRPSLRAAGARAASALLGLLLVPSAVVAYFAARGALGALVSQVVLHNFQPGFDELATPSLRMLVFPVAAPLLWFGARAIIRHAPSDEVGWRRCALFLTTGIYFTAMESYWPLITGQNFLPIFPLAWLLVIPGGLAALRGAAVRQHVPRALSAALSLAPVLFAVVVIALALREAPPWRDRCRDYTAFLAEALRLTRPGEYVMDLRGETVFRRRPFFYALERVTRQRMARGLIPDTVAERIVKTGTCVVVGDSDGLPPAAREFLNRHFVPVSGFRVVGSRLDSASANESGARSFEVLFPARFAVVSEGGSASGWLDGAPYVGPRTLSAGNHEYLPRADERGLAVVWAAALERGFAPIPAP